MRRTLTKAEIEAYRELAHAAKKLRKAQEKAKLQQRYRGGGADRSNGLEVARHA
jgi:hypothetical protein